MPSGTLTKNSAPPIPIRSRLYARRKGYRHKRFRETVASGFAPPGNLPTPDWAEKSIELSPRVGPKPGPLRLYPYQRRPLECLKTYEQVLCLWAAQTGKTIIIQTFLGYVIDQDPGPVMVVYPDEKTCKKRSRKHIKPMIKDSPVLARHLTGRKDDFQLYEFILDRCNVVMAWSGSPAQMASEPIRYLIRDEIGKFAGQTATEAGSINLSEVRLRAYEYVSKILDVTTPSLKDSYECNTFESGTAEEYFVPCPHCKTMQVITWKQIKYPDIIPDEKPSDYKTRVKRDTYAECSNPACKGKITNNDMARIIWDGEWRARNPGADIATFHLAAWYAPYVTFGKIAWDWLSAQGDLDKLRHVINSHFAEGWEVPGESADENHILLHKASYPPDTVPTTEPVILVGTADIHKEHQDYVIRAHSLRKSWLVNYGTYVSIDELDEVFEAEYPDLDGNLHGVKLVMIDSKYSTPAVYEYCVEHPHAVPIRGEENLRTVVKPSVTENYPNSMRKLGRPIRLWNIDSRYFREQLLIYLSHGMNNDGTIDLGQADWFIHRDVTARYAKELCGDKKIKRKNRMGYEEEVWKQVGPNHFGDLEIYQLGARHILRPQLEIISGVRQQPKGPKVTYQTLGR